MEPVISASPAPAAVEAEAPQGVAKRKMATIQVVRNIRPIEGADKILKASVLGWETVIKVNEFKEGGSRAPNWRATSFFRA